MIFSRIAVTVLSVVLGWSCVAATSFKLATVSPDGSAWTIALRNVGTQIESATNGRVKFKIYPGGVMGDDTAIMRKMRARQLHGGVFQSGAFSISVPQLNTYNVPLLFRSFEEAIRVRAVMDEELMNDMRERGFEPLGFVTLGFAHAMSSKYVSSVAHARQLKVWVPKGDLSAIQFLRGFGISPIPLTIVDVQTGLQTGLIDTIAAPPVSAIALQWHTQIEYFLDIPFMYIFSIVALDKKQFDRIGVEDQKTFRTLMRATLADIEDLNIKDHVETRNVLKKLGVEFVSPSADEMAEWRGVAAKASEEWINSNAAVTEFYRRLNNTLKEARTSVVH